MFLEEIHADFLSKSVLWLPKQKGNAFLARIGGLHFLVTAHHCFEGAKPGAFFQIETRKGDFLSLTLPASSDLINMRDIQRKVIANLRSEHAGEIPIHLKYEAEHYCDIAFFLLTTADVRKLEVAGASFLSESHLDGTSAVLGQTQAYIAGWSKWGDFCMFPIEPLDGVQYQSPLFNNINLWFQNPLENGIHPCRKGMSGSPCVVVSTEGVLKVIGVQSSQSDPPTRLHVAPLMPSFISLNQAVESLALVAEG